MIWFWIVAGLLVVAALIALLRPLGETPPPGTPREQALALSAALSGRIRRGDVPLGTLEALRRIAELKLRTASPRYLERR